MAAPGVVALIGMYAVLFAYGEQHPAFSPFGVTSDIAVLIQYALALPIPLALHRLLGDRAAHLSFAVTGIATAAMIAIVVLQVLLFAGVLQFEEQIGLISSAFLVLVVWFAVTGYLGRSTGRLSWRALLMSLLGASYFGYPIWAFWLGQKSAIRGLPLIGRRRIALGVASVLLHAGIVSGEGNRASNLVTPLNHRATPSLG